MKRTWISQLLLRVIMIGLFGTTMSCGSSSGTSFFDGGIGGTGDASPTTDDGETVNQGISVGRITGFGSVFVNGIEFRTDNAVITVDRNLARERDLRIGMVVTVEGTFDPNGLTGNANRITYEEAVIGPVESINLVTNTVVVLGQSILTTDDTVFDGVTLETMTVRNLIEVSGFPTSTGQVQATRIELILSEVIPGVTELELAGIVENLNAPAMTFMIGALLIDFSNAELDDLPRRTLSNGLRVEVESREGIVNGVLIANNVEGQESTLDDAEGGLVEIEGVVTNFASPNNFKVNGIPVRTDTITLYENGTADDLAVDVRVEVEGVRDADGVLLADEIEFQLEGTVEIEADIQAVDPENGTLVLLGLTVSLDNQTVVFDGRDEDIPGFGIKDLMIGDRVAVIGNPVGSEIIAIRVERKSASSEVSLKGPVTSIAAPTIQILSVGAITTEETDFENSDDRPISASEFFGQLEIGTVIEVDGILTSGNVILTEEAELED